MTFEIQHDRSGTKGKFYIEQEGVELGLMTYSVVSEKSIIIEHTEVDASLKGSGAGVSMVNYAVEKARQEGFKIRPLCPFVNACFKKHPEFNDVLL